MAIPAAYPCGAMAIFVACNSCRKTFEAARHHGLVRCAECQEAHAPRFKGLGTERKVLA